VRRPFLTPLDFRAATAPTYQLLQLAMVVLVLAALGPLPSLAPASLAWGATAGAAFVAAPLLVGVARGECLHQFEIRDLHGLATILPRNALLVAATVPAIALAEEAVFRGALAMPWPAIAIAQWLWYAGRSRERAGATALACLFLAGLHAASGDLGLVVGAHAAIQALTGRLASPGLFGDAYPVLEQVGVRHLAPALHRLGLQLAAAAVLVGLLR
jgi:hypothetical protein